MLAIASYNAGPGTKAGETTSSTPPELWVERIPYPETRYYTKKVMDNLLRYADLNQASANKTGLGKA